MKNLLKTFAVVATLTLTPLMAAGEYVNNDILISAEDAMGLVGKKNVMFVSGDSDDVYKLGHIKGSVEMYAHHLHHSDITGEMHCAPLYRCIDDAEQYIGSKGIDNDTLVIAYDDFKGPNATGVYSFFQSYGHKNLKILNGGRNAMMQVDPAQAKYDAIKDELKAEKSNSKAAKKELKNAAQEKTKLSAKKKAELDKIISVSEKAQKALEAKLKAAEKDLIVVKGEEHVTPKKYKIDQKNIDLSFIAAKEEVKHAMEDILKNGKDSKFVIIDARGMAEIIGERKMDNVARGGHVPGSTFMEWNKISDMENKKSFKSATALKEVYAKYGITKDKTIYAYCMVGAGRGSEHITALKLLGYENIKVFTGSWDVWGNDMNLPIKK
ncbi:MAG: sulfurtransferase [Epsilonproteobacteria bacterium]|nr:sulfurtransferase [Campylobacterota bacterium]OIO17060.1 MAG: sulfurtransferase [Helicobacteraceae bacterium CG1_02_36_14]PIP09228.1 MAG: sulfurtransferase [Sulfurimonas sp. CG23_combo_of_CG06-09_8_20_14_all_36_33]PIS24641.1 MAG: sulfurtransferase [Sulfurimonas sp. CG08_land_8_20_14_0_20_36_33]PIU34990.1 MAG: sulfurtransferase [Sulfurimonas sp. CG07_land_8_20_14_0_80_36_56]PIV02970.1 MAG: sulfurtransferase [Sulfurimonas sp. CG03_land_8_20_14_0_80_36_25]PIV36734.1 MAG: sulfurtransferase [Su